MLTDCSSNKETHSFSYSDIKYNNSGQKIGYKLQMHCSRTDKTYNIEVSDITYDKLWKVISYKAVIDGKEYNYTRQ